MFWIPAYILLGAYTVFVAYLVVVVMRIKAVSDDGSEKEYPAVSIVIPFRNEAHNLDVLLESLFDQDYKGEFEIVLVDDGSDDDFKGVLIRHQRSGARPFRVIRHYYNENIRLTSKQQALDLGIQTAMYPWIACTDADMRLHNNWLTSLIEPTFDGASFVFGHTAIRKNTGDLFEWFQSFQLEFLFAVAYTFHYGRITGSCMGNNLLFRKEEYNAIGGQKSIGYSIVEDRDLLYAFQSRKYTIRPAQPFCVTAETFASTHVYHFVNQAIRWARGGLSIKSNLFPYGILSGLQTVFLIVFVAGVLPYPFGIVISLNILLTWIFCYCAFEKIHSRQSAVYFPLFYIFMVCETISIGLLLIFKRKFTWKNRTIRR